MKLNEKRSYFKLYAGDTGLLCALSMDNIQFGILQGDLSVNVGSILKIVMTQMLARIVSLYIILTQRNMVSWIL